jgi:hypothetical protein
MPSPRNALAALGVSVAVCLAFLLYVGWPTFLAVATGGVFGLVFLVIATSLGDDPAAADAAWRAAAGDLVERPPVTAGGRSGSPPGAGPGVGSESGLEGSTELAGTAKPPRLGGGSVG